MDFLPTRVLDFGLEEMNLDDLKVKVIHADGRRREKYMTLSHCWGPRSHVTTQLLTQNLAEYETKGIPLHQLPNTFRHAVLFTRGTRCTIPLDRLPVYHSG
jgi:hypothetical protein